MLKSLLEFHINTFTNEATLWCVNVLIKGLEIRITVILTKPYRPSHLGAQPVAALVPSSPAGWGTGRWSRAGQGVMCPSTTRPTTVFCDWQGTVPQCRLYSWLAPLKADWPRQADLPILLRSVWGLLEQNSFLSSLCHPPSLHSLLHVRGRSPKEGRCMPPEPIMRRGSTWSHEREEGRTAQETWER